MGRDHRAIRILHQNRSLAGECALGDRRTEGASLQRWWAASMVCQVGLGGTAVKGRIEPKCRGKSEGSGCGRSHRSRLRPTCDAGGSEAAARALFGCAWVDGGSEAPESRATGRGVVQGRRPSTPPGGGSGFSSCREGASSAPGERTPELAARCLAAGFPPITDEPLEGFDRLYMLIRSGIASSF